MTTNIEWIGTSITDNRVDYHYRVSGEHEGEPIDIWMRDVEEEVDEDGARLIYRCLTDADGNPLPDEIEDAYSDILHEDLDIMLRELG